MDSSAPTTLAPPSGSAPERVRLPTPTPSENDLGHMGNSPMERTVSRSPRENDAAQQPSTSTSQTLTPVDALEITLQDSHSDGVSHNRSSRIPFPTPLSQPSRLEPEPFIATQSTLATAIGPASPPFARAFPTRSHQNQTANAPSSPPLVRAFSTRSHQSLPALPRPTSPRSILSGSSIRIGHNNDNDNPIPDIPLPGPRPRPQPRPPITARIRRALGIATPRASLIWRLAFGLFEIVLIGVLLGLASRPGSVPTNVRGMLPNGSTTSQYKACDRPLGAWNIVWGIKAFLAMAMAGWEYWRAIRPSVDQILAVERARLGREIRRARNNLISNPIRAPPLAHPASPPTRSPTRTNLWTMGAAGEEDLDVIDATMSGSSRSLRIVEYMREIRLRREREERLYSRCASFQALYGLVWFITANILLYGSMNSCRYTSPYVWWLTFGLLCLGYIVVAEMVLVALVVFILGPLVYLTINVILVCLGRHPIQPGGRMGHINPDVPKMPRGMVDRIPLVMYIPAPAPPTGDTTPTPDANQQSQAQGEHVYPPGEAGKHGKHRHHRRFFFFKKKKPTNAKSELGADVETDAGWEKSEYPFVKLEQNRAACAICLTDFEPPRRVGDDRDAPSAAEPLRLLACGHVFHKECLDPWLVDVSGRCPTCQRPVEEGDLDPEEGAKKPKRRWGRRS